MQLVLTSLNPEGHQNCITFSKVIAFLLDEGGGVFLLVEVHREGSATVVPGPNKAHIWAIPCQKSEEKGQRRKMDFFL